EIDAGGAHEGGPEINSESFTSLGGNLPFYFGPTGAPLSGAPVTRFKPDIAAPDGTNTTFFGSSDPELDGYPNFYGTSAAAPHAAAVAALMLEAQPSLTPDEVYARLKDTALDIDSVGVDTISGNGLIQAQIAVPPSYELTLLPSPCPLYDSTSATGGLSGAIPGNTSRTVQVSGSLPAAQGVGTHSCVPAGASGVLYTISVLSPQRVGNLRLSEEGVVANGGVVNYADNGLNNGNTVAVPLGASGKADIYANVGATDVRLVAVGYYSDSGTLNYTPVTPCAVADSRISENPTNSYVGPFEPGAAYPDVDVVGTFPAGQGGGNTDCGIPAAADAVVVNLVSVNSASGSGYLAAGTGGTSPTEQATAFASLGMNNAATVVVPLTATGTVAVDVFGTSGTPTTEIRLVVLGYLDQATGSGYTPVNPCAAFDSRTGLGASGSFLGLRNSGVATTYQIAGTGLANQGGGNGGSCGVPVGATAVLINLVGVESVQAGNYRAYATGTTPTGGVLNFAPLVPAMNNSNAVVVPLDSLGQMDLFVNTHNNNGTGTTHARGVVLGYYRGTSPGVGD
ncbi:MAG: S8 family serine peptidase, partial [Actinomycetia bacterium]|nr:S8 family serine peptidase [Actinomycetes bacterium]